MASVFLSYARADTARVKRLASALTRAGHQVWWDQDLYGGSRFAKEIAAALDRAEVVLVVWSRNSIDSAWVQDEASAGRDGGRLVPVAIDPVDPPLGFRQFQTVDLSKWKGRSAPDTVLRAIAAVSRQQPKAELPIEQSAAPKRRRTAQLAVAAATAVLLLVAGWLLLERIPTAHADEPTVAVLPFADLSPEGDKAYFAEGVAEAILSLLASEPGIRVIGRSSSSQFRQGSVDHRKVRKALGVTHFLEGSARTSGDELRMSVRLIDARDGTQVWAEDYQRRLGNIFAVQDEIGRAVAERLKGSIVQRIGQAAQQTAAIDTYTLYLAARAKMRDRNPRHLREALDFAERITAREPRYAPGHALRADLLWLLSVEEYGPLPRNRAFEMALPHARRAIELAPDAAEGYAALGQLLRSRDPRAAVGPLAKAASIDPSRAEVQLWLARSYRDLGRDSEALEHLRRAVETEPLWGPGMVNLATSLQTAGRGAEADEVIRSFEERGGSAAIAAWARRVPPYLSGDLSEGIRFVFDARRHGLEIPQAFDFLAWNLRAVGLGGAAQRIGAKRPTFTRLFLAGDRNALLREIHTAGASVWAEADDDVAVAALASARDWQHLRYLYDQRPPRQQLCPDYSGDSSARFRRSTGSIAIVMAQALMDGGKNAEAARLLRCTEDYLALQSRGVVRGYGFGDAAIAFARAQIFALTGRRGAALEMLNRAVGSGWRTSYGSNLRDYPAFDTLPADQVAVLQRKLDQLLAAEGAEVQRFCGACRA